MYLEYASGLAEAVTIQLGGDAEPREIAALMFRRLLSRSPEKQELKAILEFYQRHKLNPQVWMLTARALMNTDEAITSP